MTVYSNPGVDARNPDGYPVDYVQPAVLGDGTRLLIRPIRPADAPGLQKGFHRLSPQSIYLRFLSAFDELSDKQAQEFATVDYQNRMAIVAEIEENGEKNLIGVARYSMVAPLEEGVAESAIVVADEYQGRGLGTLMLKRLVKYARDHDVQAMLATVHHTNSRIMRFIQRSGLHYEKKMIEPGVWEVKVILQALPE